MPELATITGLTKEYVTDSGVVVALSAVDALVPEGSVTALVGVSGSGKSTLLRLLAGLERPTAGALEVAGVDLAAADAAVVRRFRSDTVAFVAQRAADNLVPHLTLADHLPEGGGQAVDDLGIAHRLHARPSELSGGELARAAFAVALSRGTRLVLADEPTAELDSATAAAVLRAIAAAAARGTSVVVATHDPDVVAIADHVVELERGRNRGAGVVAPAHASTSGGEVVLRAQHISKSYGSFVALDDVSVELRARQLAVVVGRSGSGKSTLLMILGGWQRPDRGPLAIDTSWRQLGFVPQRFGLVAELTVRENVALPARLAGLDEPVDALLASLALDDLADRYPAQISIGQQQRVALARAVSLTPAVLLVDEPTSHQDVASAELVWECIGRAAAAGSACLVATHEPDAGRRADVEWQIEDGRFV